MAEKSVQALQERYNRLLHNGKNTEGSGVLRKIQREIRHARQAESKKTA